MSAELIAFHGREHGPQDFRPENVCKRITALLAKPEQQFTVGRVLADQPCQSFLQLRAFAFLNQQLRKLLAQARGHPVDRMAEHFTPALGIDGLE
jgi:hypothetical protein